MLLLCQNEEQQRGQGSPGSLPAHQVLHLHEPEEKNPSSTPETTVDATVATLSIKKAKTNISLMETQKCKFTLQT